MKKIEKSYSPPIPKSKRSYLKKNKKKGMLEMFLNKRKLKRSNLPPFQVQEAVLLPISNFKRLSLTNKKKRNIINNVSK